MIVNEAMVIWVRCEGSKPRFLNANVGDLEQIVTSLSANLNNGNT